jgi:hypothetical protein
MEVTFPFERRIEHMGQTSLQQLRQILWGELALQFRALCQLSKKMIQVRLHRHRRLVIFHVT